MAADSRPSEMHFATAALLASSLAVIIPVLATSAGLPPANVNTGFVLLWLLAAYSGIRISAIFAFGSSRPMQIGFWIFTYLFLGIAPMVQISSSTWPLADVPASSTILPTVLIAWIGVIAWDLAYLVASRSNRPQGRRYRSDVHFERVRPFYVFSIVMTSLFIAIIGLAPLFTSREALSEAIVGGFGSETSTGAVALALATVPIAISLILAIRHRASGARNATGALAALIAANLIVASPIATPRFWLGTVVIAAFIAWGSNTGSNGRMRWLVIVWLSAFVIVFPLADAFRLTNQADQKQLSGFRGQVTADDYDAFQQMSNGVTFVRNNGFQSGEQLLGTALFFIPRDTWVSKPRGTGEVLAIAAGYDSTNRSSPLWIEGYTDFGVAGTIMLLATLGLISASLDSRFTVAISGGGGSLWLVAVPMLAAYQMMVLRGSLIVVMPRLVVMIVCWWILSSRAFATCEASGQKRPRIKTAAFRNRGRTSP